MKWFSAAAAIRFAEAAAAFAFGAGRTVRFARTIGFAKPATLSLAARGTVRPAESSAATFALGTRRTVGFARSIRLAKTAALPFAARGTIRSAKTATFAFAAWRAIGPTEAAATTLAFGTGRTVRFARSIRLAETAATFAFAARGTVGSAETAALGTGIIS